MALAVTLPQSPQAPPPLIQELEQVSAWECRALAIVEQMRPKPFRVYDQIPMRSPDLLRQVKSIAPCLANGSVAFMGDSDGTSVLLGLLASSGLPSPARMLVLDFDKRLLDAMNTVAHQYGFADRLQLCLYNAFDPIPSHLVHQYDWFYTNPPYGCRNGGESTRLFIARGAEVTRAQGGRGCIIAPFDSRRDRAWTGPAMLATQRFLATHGWVLSTVVDRVHRYHLDDDQDLPSSLLVVEHVEDGQSMPYVGKAVDMRNIPHFYSRTIQPPYPRYIRASGCLDYAWAGQEGAA